MLFRSKTAITFPGNISKFKVLIFKVLSDFLTTNLSNESGLSISLLSTETGNYNAF